MKASASGVRGRASKSALPFATRLAILFFAPYTVFAQTDAAAAAGVLLVKLSPPVYPPWHARRGSWVM